jgi:hypothetical protein
MWWSLEKLDELLLYFRRAASVVSVVISVVVDKGTITDHGVYRNMSHHTVSKEVGATRID